MVLTGDGFSFSSLSFRFGGGIGGGISFDPVGGPPDSNLPCGATDGIGVYADASATIGFIGAGIGANYGATRSIGPKRRARYSEYGGMTPASELGIEVKGGIQLQGGFGVEMTKYFNSKECTCGEIN